MKTSRLYIESMAYAGDPAAWTGDALVWPRNTSPEKERLRKYPTRRLDAMAGYAVKASLQAVAACDIPDDVVPSLGVISLSHNGPCIFCEDFYRDLITEPDPRLVSPSFFAESVLNIVTTHISLALKTRVPAYAFNAALDDFFTVLDTTFLLVRAKQFERGVLAFSEEFSGLARELIASCKQLPGSAFGNGALAWVFSAAPESGSRPGLYIEASQSSDTTEEAVTALSALQRDRGTRIVRSAFSVPEHVLFKALPDSVDDPVISVQAMDSEQMFHVLRAAEVAALLTQMPVGSETALVQATPNGVRWLVTGHSA